MVPLAGLSIVQDAAAILNAVRSISLADPRPIALPPVPANLPVCPGENRSFRGMIGRLKPIPLIVKIAKESSTVDSLRQEVISQTDIVVVKVGTRVLTRSDGHLDEDQIRRLSEGLCSWLESGRKVVLVSSGAVGAGMSQMGWKERPNDLAHLQAVAAIGQTKLIEAYDRILQHHGRMAGQVLLTADDLNHHGRYLNVRNTLLTLMHLGAVPIVNENDTVAVDELQTTFGDNDRLAAMVTNLLRAPLLVILSDVQGLYDGDPRLPSSQRIPTVTAIDDQVLGYVQLTKNHLSKGGMGSKLEAARIATTAGENVIIAGGHEPQVLQRILACESVGTLFTAQGKRVTPWKRWIAFAVRPRGEIIVDAGACQALVNHGKSLLAIGITDSIGNFDKGDVVSIRDQERREIARGLTNYSAADILRIRGLRSSEILELLGQCPYEEVVHRDNLAVTSCDRESGSEKV